MPRHDEIEEFIIEKARELASRKSITLPANVDNLNLVDAGIVDSLGFVDVMAALESHFTCVIDLSTLDPEEFATVSGLTRAVRASIGDSDFEGAHL